MPAKSHALFAAALAALTVGGASASAATETNVMVVFDASGSMKRAAGEETRISAAKRVVSETLASMPATVRTGLLAYGHRRARDCTDVEVISPIGADSAQAQSAMVRRFSALGETPIADALDRAGQSMRAFKGQRNSIVLVTDGVEECRGDPCAAADRLKELGIDVKVHVVGFALKPGESRALQCVVDKTGGRYFNAADATALRKTFAEVRQVVAQAPAPVPAPPPPAPKPKAYFQDEFNGKDLKDVWQIKQPVPDAYIVEKGQLLMIAQGQAGFDVPKTPNLMQLSTEMPDGNWEMKTVVQANYATGKEVVWIGLYGDEKNFIAAKLSQTYEGALKFNLEIVKRANRQQVEFKKAIRQGQCNWGGCEKTEFPKLAQGLKMPMTLSLVKKGREYLARLTLKRDTDKTGNQIVYQTAPVSSLRSPGKPALTVGQSAPTNGETLFYFDRVEIDALTISAASPAGGSKQFSDFPATETIRGNLSAPDTKSAPKQWSAVRKIEKDIIREEMAKGPNFAGAYYLATVGCGSGCEAIFVIDLRDGRILAAPEAATNGVSFQKDSRLMIINENKTYDLPRNHFVFTGGEFKKM